jgi:hypothetical protein
MQGTLSNLTRLKAKRGSTMRKILIIATIPLIFISTGWISKARGIDQSGLHIDHHPQHVAACKRAIGRLNKPGHDTWKNRLQAWQCFERQN